MASSQLRDQLEISALNLSSNESERYFSQLKSAYIELGVNDIFLQVASERSVVKVLGMAPKRSEDFGFGQIWYSNSGGEAMITYVGADSGGNFSHFDLYPSANLTNDLPFLKDGGTRKIEWNYVNTDNFLTMRGIRLGARPSEVISVYGTNWMRMQTNGQSVFICYSNWYFKNKEIVNSDSNGYYNSKYEFVSNRLKKISFGFNTYI